MPVLSNSFDRWVAEWAVQREGIYEGTTTLADFPGESTKRGKRKAAAADAALEGDTSGDVGTEEKLSEYEQQRLDRIARNDAVMVSLGIDCSQTRALPRGGAPASKPVPATNPGSGESTKRDKGKAPAEPSENARDTSVGVSKSHQGGSSGQDVQEQIAALQPRSRRFAVRLALAEKEGAVASSGHQQHRSRRGGGRRRKPEKKCPHGRRKSRCIECGGSSICEHNRERGKCSECGGASICEHKRQRSQCGECGAPPSASTTERGASAANAGAPPSASTNDVGASASNAGAPPSASTKDRGACASNAGAPPSASTNDRGASASNAGAPPSASTKDRGASAGNARVNPGDVKKILTTSRQDVQFLSRTYSRTYPLHKLSHSALNAHIAL